uniref:hypothetical protein n=1 Tax=Proteiniphilum sp. UBA5259 TaxID=1947269 RepID=UPI00257987E7
NSSSVDVFNVKYLFFLRNCYFIQLNNYLCNKFICINATIVFDIHYYYYNNDHDPLGGYVNFHIRKQVLLLLRTIRLSR